MSTLRSQIGPDFPLALAAFPYVDFHPAFPFSVFLGPGGAQYNLPQLYWKTIGDSVDDGLRPHLRLQPRLRPADPAARPGLPEPEDEADQALPQARPRPRDGGRQLVVVAARRQAPVEGGRRQGEAAERLRPLRQLPLPPARLEGRPGRLGPAAPRRAAATRPRSPATSRSRPARAVLAMQANRGLAQTGNLDVPTWNVLLTLPAAGGALDRERRRRRLGAGSAARAALGQPSRQAQRDPAAPQAPLSAARA